MKKTNKRYRVLIEFSCPLEYIVFSKNKVEAKKKIYGKLSRLTADKTIVKSLTQVEEVVE